MWVYIKAFFSKCLFKNDNFKQSNEYYKDYKKWRSITYYSNCPKTTQENGNTPLQGSYTTW